MKRIWFLVLAVSVGLNAGLAYTVLAPKGRPSDPGLPPPDEKYESLLDEHLGRMAESLDLDEKQRAAIAAVHEELFPKIVDHHQAVHALRMEAADAYRRSELDPTEFRLVVQKLSREREQLDGLVAEAMLGEAAALTEEQRLKYAGEMPWGKPPGARRPRGDQPPPGGGRDRPPPGGGR